MLLLNELIEFGMVLTLWNVTEEIVRTGFVILSAGEDLFFLRLRVVLEGDEINDNDGCRS